MIHFHLIHFLDYVNDALDLSSPQPSFSSAPRPPAPAFPEVNPVFPARCPTPGNDSDEDDDDDDNVSDDDDDNVSDDDDNDEDNNNDNALRHGHPRSLPAQPLRPARAVLLAVPGV